MNIYDRWCEFLLTFCCNCTAVVQRSYVHKGLQKDKPEYFPQSLHTVETTPHPIDKAITVLTTDVTQKKMLLERRANQDHTMSPSEVWFAGLYGALTTILVVQFSFKSFEELWSHKYHGLHICSMQRLEFHLFCNGKWGHKFWGKTNKTQKHLKNTYQCAAKGRQRSTWKFLRSLNLIAASI